MREAREITSQEKLGELACDLHRTFIRRVERGETNISVENLEAIAKAVSNQMTPWPYDVTAAVAKPRIPSTIDFLILSRFRI